MSEMNFSSFVRYAFLFVIKMIEKEFHPLRKLLHKFYVLCYERQFYNVQEKEAFQNKDVFTSPGYFEQFQQKLQ